MESANQSTQSVAGTVPTDLAAMLRQYQYYGHGRSMRQFCEDENLDYSRFCRYARNHPVSQESATSDIVPDTFVELKVLGEDVTAAAKPSSVLDLNRPVPGCTFGTDMLSYALWEKYCYNVPFDQIVVKLSHLGFRISKSTLGDILHRAIEWLREKMSETWSKAIRLAKYWMMDETPLLVGIVDKTTGEKSYRKKYVWVIRANVMKDLQLNYVLSETPIKSQQLLIHLDSRRFGNILFVIDLFPVFLPTGIYSSASSVRQGKTSL